MKKLVLMVFTLLLLVTGCSASMKTQSMDEAPVLLQGDNFKMCKISPDIIENPTVDTVGPTVSEKDRIEKSGLIVKCRLLKEPEYVSFTFTDSAKKYNTTLFTVEILKVFYTDQDIKKGDIIQYFSKSFIDYYRDENTPLFESYGVAIPQKDQEFYIFLYNIRDRKVAEVDTVINNAQLEVTPYYSSLQNIILNSDIDNSIAELTKKYKG